MPTRYIIPTQRSIAQYDNAPGISWRGIRAGLWLTSAMVILVSLVPGIAITLGNLPGDIDAGSSGGSVHLPIASITLLVVTLTGISTGSPAFLTTLTTEDYPALLLEFRQTATALNRRIALPDSAE